MRRPQRITELTDPSIHEGWWNKNKRSAAEAKLQDEIKHNEMVDEYEARISAEAQQLFERLPKPLQVDVARKLSAGVIDLKEFVTDEDVRRIAGISALGVGGTTAALAGAGGMLSAYAQQDAEGLNTNPFAVAGRAINNLSTPQYATVGTDPLASARNHVASAADIVGTEAMLEALTLAEMKQMRDERDAAAAVIGKDTGALGGVQDMIDARAAQLMQQPIQKADGSVGPMPFDMAQRYATEQINMELRAGDIY